MSKSAQNMNRTANVALITGSRRGIGLGIAIELSKAGFDIVLNGTSARKDSQDAIEAVKTHGVDCRYVRADISKRTARATLISQVQQHFGKLNMLVNNAGVAPEKREDILVATEESFDRLMRINLKGPYFLTRDIAGWMIAQKKIKPQEKFCIINIVSVNAYTASPSRGEYCVSKAGLAMMTSLFAVRLAEYGIGVYEIRPGLIKTDMTIPVRDKYSKLIAEGFTPIARWGIPEDIGKAAVALAKDYLPFSTGDVINVDGGYHLRTF
jgi:NAD(P)-dependent dehydrogenase (short-subunit alcohol dehydrogenase family)